MRVLVACEYSGRVRDAFAARGHHAVSVDILPSETDGHHVRSDVVEYLRDNPDWDMIIAFPPCQKLCSLGARYWPRYREEGTQQAAIAFFMFFAEFDCERIAIENPSGIMSTLWRKPDQYVHPYFFGEPWKKRTGLWLKNLPLLVPTNVVEPTGHWVDGGTMIKKGSGGYHTGAYQAAKRRGDPNSSHGKERSRTFVSIANAMAEQWG